MGCQRTLILPQFVLKALEQQHMHQMEARLQAGTNWRDSDLVFCNIYGRYLDPGSLHDQFAALLKKAGLLHMRFHDLRHSAATMLLSMGVPMKVVQELLGHSSFTITANIYSHVLPSMLEGAMDKWDDFFVDRNEDRPGVSARASVMKSLNVGTQMPLQAMLAESRSNTSACDGRISFDQHTDTKAPSLTF